MTEYAFQMRDTQTRLLCGEITCFSLSVIVSGGSRTPAPWSPFPPRVDATFRGHPEKAIEGFEMLISTLPKQYDDHGSFIPSRGADTPFYPRGKMAVLMGGGEEVVRQELVWGFSCTYQGAL